MDSASTKEKSINSRSKPSVFVSHRSNDINLAECLAEEIRKAGFQVWIDTWNIKIGDSIIKTIDEGLEDAAYLIICYSESGVLSPWMSREWMSALARQLAGYNVKILPVRLSGGAPPAILADIKFADLVKNWNAGITELLWAMK
jgi:hypothetical protein